MADYRIAATLPAPVKLDKGNGTLPCLRVSSERHGTAEVYLHGAHLAAWQPKGRAPVIFLSQDSAFDPAKPIRGGVPVCFPWFGPHATDKQAPMHGFARIEPWALVEAQDTADAITLAFSLTDNERTRGSAWPHAFEATYRITMGTSLELSLERAQHRARPGDVRGSPAHLLRGEGRAAGLDRGTRAHRVPGQDGQVREEAARGQPVTITGETDRIYLATRATCVIDDPGLGRTITVGKTGSDTTVVWNPWIERARAIADIGDDEWTVFVCVETCNVVESVGDARARRRAHHAGDGHGCRRRASAVSPPAGGLGLPVGPSSLAFRATGHRRALTHRPYGAVAVAADGSTRRVPPRRARAAAARWAVTWHVFRPARCGRGPGMPRRRALRRAGHRAAAEVWARPSAPSRGTRAATAPGPRPPPAS